MRASKIYYSLISVYDTAKGGNLIFLLVRERIQVEDDVDVDNYKTILLGVKFKFGIWKWVKYRMDALNEQFDYLLKKYIQ